MTGTRGRTIEQRLREGIAVDENGCWMWQRSTTTAGYGQIFVLGRNNVYTHRLAYELFVGEIPEGLEVMHECDVNHPGKEYRRCCNPEHLRVGTHHDNVADMIAKGRHVPIVPLYGEAHPGTTLTDAQVAEVRALRVRGVPQRKVAARFGVSQSTVWRLAHRRVRNA